MVSCSGGIIQGKISVGQKSSGKLPWKNLRGEGQLSGGNCLGETMSWEEFNGCNCLGVIVRGKTFQE